MGNNIASSFLSHKYYPDYIGDQLVDGKCIPYSDDRHSDLKDDASHYANIWMMVPFSISAALSPFLGAFVDRVGKRALLMLTSAIVLTCVHLFLGLSNSVLTLRCCCTLRRREKLRRWMSLQLRQIWLFKVMFNTQRPSCSGTGLGTVRV